MPRLRRDECEVASTKGQAESNQDATRLRRRAHFPGTIRVWLVSIVVEIGAFGAAPFALGDGSASFCWVARSRLVPLVFFEVAGCRQGRRRYLACFAVCPEYAINIALRSSRDGTLEYSVERQREGSRRIGCTTHGRTHRTTDGRSVRVLPALLVEAYGAKLQDDLRELRLLHVVFGLLLKPASP
jgi:hypothetical protein